MLASPLLQPESHPPKGGNIASAKDSGLKARAQDSSNPNPFREVSTLPNLEYVQLQQRIFRLTLIVSAVAVVISAFFFGIETAGSVLLGAFSGVLYLRLLARSVGKIGDGTRNFGKVQLVVPVLLVLGTSRFSELHLLPALLGFFIYKPSVIFQFFLDSLNLRNS